MSTIAIMGVEEKDVSKYGIAEVEDSDGPLYKVRSLVEKPKAIDTKSRWALPGRYVFDSHILEILENAKPTLNNEIQLTDSMKILCERFGMNAMTFKAKRFDAGDKLGYMQANIELGLRNADIGVELKNYILNLAAKLKG